MTSYTEPPEALRWIIGSQHIEAWTNAAHWLHANSHIDDGFVRQRVTGDPCEDCWRAAVYATKGVVLAGYQRPGCPDPIECDHEAEVGQLRAELADMVSLHEARVTLQMFRIAIGSSVTQITDLIHTIGRATGPLARAERDAAAYKARWESTVVEARRQAARADDLEQQAETAAWNTMRLGEDRNRLRNENAQLRAELDRARAELATARAQVDDLHGRLDDAAAAPSV